MSEEQKKQHSENQNQQNQKVELDTETYQALLDKLTDLEDQVKSKERSNEDEDEVSRLAREAQRKQGQEERQPIDYDGLSNKQLVEAIGQGVEETVLVPLLTRIEEVELRMEIKDLLSETDEKGNKLYGNFWDYKDEIYEIAKDNPKLSLKRCYQLARSGKSEQSKTEKREKGSGEDRLRHLPKVPIIGEKPGGPSSSSMSEEEPQTRKEALGKVYDQLFEGKE
jgi:hypothetical protein